MIRVSRGTEPRGLVRARGNRLKKAAAAYAAHGAASQEFSDTLVGYGSRTTKEKLYLAQKKKCAWCERRRDLSSSPVEHYRPKAGAWRYLPGETPSVVDPEHYWWLTWTWTNLLFSCDRCNDQGHKANYFPLERPSAALSLPPNPMPDPLSPSLFDVSAERPLLLDPADASIDPLDHIRWRPVDTRPERRFWSWSPKGITQRGAATIRILKLEELADEVDDHLRRCVLPSIEEIEKHLAHGRGQDAKERWDQLLQDTLAPKSPLSGAAWCALEYLMPDARRKNHGLATPRRPGA